MTLPRNRTCDKAYPTRRDASGHYLCAFCGKPNPKGRRRYCSDACAQEVHVRSGNLAGMYVFRRDKGKCARCGCDTDALAKAARVVAKQMALAHGLPSWKCRAAIEGVLQIPRGRSCSQLWDAHHRVPVVAGGGGCGLDGYETLCLWCHARATARQRKEAAQAGREERESQLPLIELGGGEKEKP